MVKYFNNIKFILLVALLIRLSFTFTFFGNSYKQIHDEIAYMNLAKNIHIGKGIILDFPKFDTVVGGKPTAFWEPIYPIILSLFYGFEESKFIFIRIFQNLINIITILIFYLFIKRFWDLRIAVIGAWILSFYPLHIVVSNIFVAETLFTTFLLLSFFLFYLVLFDQNVKHYKYIILGVILGITSLIKSTIVGFIPMMFIIVFFYKKDKIKSLVGIALAIIAIIVAISPWSIRNYRIYNTPFILTTKVGYNLYNGNYPITEDERNRSYMNLFSMQRKIPMLNTEGLTEVERNTLYMKEGANIIYRNPLSTLKLMGIKLINLWSPFPQGEEKRKLYVMTVLLFFYLLTVIPSIYVVIKQIRDVKVFIIVSFIIYFTIIHAIFVTSIRLRVPLDIFIILLASIGIDKYFQSMTIPKKDEKN